MEDWANTDLKPNSVVTRLRTETLIVVLAMAVVAARCRNMLSPAVACWINIFTRLRQKRHDQQSIHGDLRNWRVSKGPC